MTESCDIHIESRIAISVTPPHPQELPDGVVRREYLREEIFLAVPPDSKFAKHKTVDLREVKEENFIRLETAGSSAGSAMISAGERGSVLRRCSRATVRSRCET